MTQDRRDPGTLDLLRDWEPDDGVERFDDRAVRAADLRMRIARAVSQALKDASLSREAAAEQMSEFLGDEVSKNMLDAYASAARDSHTISFERLVALCAVLDDGRPLQVGAEYMARAVILERYLPWVEVGQTADLKDEVDRHFDATRRRAKRAMKAGGRR